MTGKVHIIAQDSCTHVVCRLSYEYMKVESVGHLDRSIPPAPDPGSDLRSRQSRYAWWVKKGLGVVLLVVWYIVYTHITPCALKSSSMMQARKGAKGSADPPRNVKVSERGDIGTPKRLSLHGTEQRAHVEDVAVMYQIDVIGRSG